MITVVDYGLGNVGSVVNMLNKIGARARLAQTAAEVRSAEVIVLPGVGHFDAGMRNLRERGLVDALHERVREHGVPILGICLGMQLFTKGSEEGTLPGLGWIDAETRRFDFPSGSGLVVPHMGWNETTGGDRTLFGAFEEPPRFYYVHSYHVVCENPADVAATCHYGIDFTAAVHHGNVFGTQFHPEKSHRYGMTLLGAFVQAARGGGCCA